VLGFEVMPRPDFPFPGYWLGVNGRIQVHMAQGGVPNSELYYLGSPKNAAKDNSGVIRPRRVSRDRPREIPEALEDGRRSLPARNFPSRSSTSSSSGIRTG